VEKADFETVLRSLNQAVEIATGSQAAARVSHREIPDVREVRKKLKLKRADFAQMLGVSPRTLESWEQGKRQPSGAAGILLRIAVKNPNVVREAIF
jgi:putative transcriptional regulator